MRKLPSSLFIPFASNVYFRPQKLAHKSDRALAMRLANPSLFILARQLAYSLGQ
ncbi:hypothetical protein MPNT_300009 [Candidatus Methylacidithermus pantelleriae]|uniref:Uncharacterized protein n=1 Tax=Candidatus Methylacidithermus pantelleriae TaxID=2744239 RepID=A0A8J2BMN0_9BACT|nr:hypothetical protein MPNT_300009 [Candidatus Methylacidithermus pantelleriae]